MPDAAGSQMHANAAVCRVRSLAGQGGEMQSTFMEYTLHVHTRMEEESYSVRSEEESSGRVEYWTRADFLCLEPSTPLVMIKFKSQVSYSDVYVCRLDR
jgi:hypothetical protein